MLEASLFLSCARVDVLGDCRSGDGPFKRWDGTAERGREGNVFGTWCVLFSAMVRVLPAAFGDDEPNAGR